MSTTAQIAWATSVTVTAVCATVIVSLRGSEPGQRPAILRALGHLVAAFRGSADRQPEIHSGGGSSSRKFPDDATEAAGMTTTGRQPHTELVTDLGPQFLQEEEQALAALASWIADSRVPTIVAAYKAKANACVQPLDSILIDQASVVSFLAVMLGIGFLRPDGTQLPNPFDLSQPDHWELTEPERQIVGYAAAALHQVIIACAAELDRHGVGLDRDWPPDQCVVGQALLLDVDWSLPAGELADSFEPGVVSMLSPDFRAAPARDGRSIRATDNIERIRVALRSAVSPGPRRRAAYAGGGTRAVPTVTRLRREALVVVLKRWPNVTVAQLRLTYATGSADTPGGCFRREWTMRLLPMRSRPIPSDQTLRNDLNAIRQTD